MKTLLCSLLLLAAPTLKNTPAATPAPDEFLTTENPTPALPEPSPHKTPRPHPTPTPAYESKLPVTTSDAGVIHDLVLHEVFSEYFYGPWPQGTMWIVSDTGHWDSLLEKKGPASEARNALLSSKASAHDALVAAVNEMMDRKNESVGDPGTFDGPFEKKLVASKDTLGPLVIKPNPKKSEHKPVWGSLSSIGYSADHTIAVECAATWIGSFAGGGDCFVLEKKATGWTVTDRQVLYRQ